MSADAPLLSLHSPTISTAPPPDAEVAFIYPRGELGQGPLGPRLKSGVILGAEICAVVVGVWWFDWVFHNPTCDFMFSCGCTFNWLGGWTQCNVHNTVGDPKCPWCIAPPSTAWTTSALVRAITIAAFFVYTRTRKSWRRISRAISQCRDAWKAPNQSGDGDGEGEGSGVVGEGLVCVGKVAGEVVGGVVVAGSAWFLAVLVVGFAFFMSSPEYPYFLWYTRSS